MGGKSQSSTSNLTITVKEHRNETRQNFWTSNSSAAHRWCKAPLPTEASKTDGDQNGRHRKGLKSNSTSEHRAFVGETRPRIQEDAQTVHCIWGYVTAEGKHLCTGNKRDIWNTSWSGENSTVLPLTAAKLTDVRLHHVTSEPVDLLPCQTVNMGQQTRPDAAVADGLYRHPHKQTKQLRAAQTQGVVRC
jgi:hypothetical protein